MSAALYKDVTRSANPRVEKVSQSGRIRARRVLPRFDMASATGLVPFLTLTNRLLPQRTLCSASWQEPTSEIGR